MVVHAYFPADETRVLREAEALIERGWQVDVVCLKEPDAHARETVNGIGVYRLPVVRRQGAGRLTMLFEYAAFFLAAFRLLAILFFKKRYAVIQVHNPPDPLVFVALLPRLAGAKVVLDIHDPLPELFMNRFGLRPGSALVKVISALERLSAGWADAVITVSEPCAELLEGRGIPGNAISVVMNTADPRLFDNRGFSEKSFAGDGAPLRLIYHGALLNRYGLDTAVMAIDILKDRLPGLSLAIYGRGEAEAGLATLVAGRSLGHRVTLGGFVPASEIPRLISEADVGIVPYKKDRFTDLILPTKAFEYIVMDKPIIMSRIERVTDLLDDSAVMYFEPNNPNDLARCIVELYHTPRRMNELVRNARTLYQSIRWEVMSERYCQLIFSLSHAKKT